MAFSVEQMKRTSDSKVRLEGAAPGHYHYMVIGAGAWGKAQTLEIARSHCRKAGARRGSVGMVFLCDPTAYVDDMGHQIMRSRERVKDGEEYHDLASIQLGLIVI